MDMCIQQCTCWWPGTVMCNNISSNTGKQYMVPHVFKTGTFNTLRPRQNGRRFSDDVFICIFLIENVRIFIKISLKFVLKGTINNIPALVQVMAWRQLGYKPLSEPMMVRLLQHICVTRPQWVTSFWGFFKCQTQHLRQLPCSTTTSSNILSLNKQYYSISGPHAYFISATELIMWTWLLLITGQTIDTPILQTSYI